MFPIAGMLLLPPSRKTDKFLRIPLMKFVANITCHVVFICVMTWSQIKIQTPTEEDLSGRLFKHGQPIRLQEVLVFLWMVGSMWQELKEMRAKGQVILSTFRSGQVRSLQVMSGHSRSGQVRSGQVRSGQVRSGQVRSGQVRSGQVR